MPMLAAIWAGGVTNYPAQPSHDHNSSHVSETMVNGCGHDRPHYRVDALPDAHPFAHASDDTALAP